MIDSQLRTSGVNAEFVLRRMGEVARERFVPAAAQGFAYIDRAIALGGGRYLAAPVVQGMMLQEARPTLADKALLVDGGSGYMAELLRPLVGSLDVVVPADAAAKSRKGDYTLLVIDGAAEVVPEPLVRRLADQARVVTGIVDDGVTRLAVGRKAAGEIALLPLAEMGIPALPEFAAPKGWSF
jgi:protein-L-isoaspartate(D-aspartate) O-methyltransferase